MDIDALAARMSRLLEDIKREENEHNTLDFGALSLRKAQALQELLGALAQSEHGSITKRFIDAASPVPEGFHKMATSGDRAAHQELSAKAGEIVREYRESVEKYRRLYGSKRGEMREDFERFVGGTQEAFEDITNVYLLQVHEKAEASLRGDLSRARLDINILEKYVVKIQEFEPLARDVCGKHAGLLRQAVKSWRGKCLIGNRGTFSDLGGNDTYFPSAAADLLPAEVVREAAAALKADIREAGKADNRSGDPQEIRRQVIERLSVICRRACGRMTSHACAKLEDQAGRYYQDCMRVIGRSLETMLFPADAADGIYQRLLALEALLAREHRDLYLHDILLGDPGAA